MTDKKHFKGECFLFTVLGGNIMASRKKVINFYKDMYLGGMSEDVAEEIIAIQSQEGIASLKNCITDLDKEVIEELKKCALECNGQPILEDSEMRIGTLKPLQTVGVAYMYTAKRCLLGDGTGMGKTVETAGLINLCKLQSEQEDKDFRYLFLTDKSVIGQIQNKLIQFTGEYIHVSTGETDRVQEYINMCRDNVWCSLVANHQIINNTIFYSWLLRHIKEFDMIVIDEGYVIKNSTSSLSKNIKSLCNMVDRFVILNATPFERTIMDFYTQLSFVDKDLLPVQTDFKNEFCKISYRGFRPDIVGTKNEELFRKRISLRYFARRRADNGAVIENNRGHVIFSKLSTEQRYLMSRTSMWRMVCDCPQALDSDVDFNEESVPKLKDLTDILNRHKDESIYIFCYYKEAQASLREYLLDLGYSAEIINGDTKVKELDTVVNEFNNGNIQILISNKQRGIDTQGCNIVIFYSFDFNSSRMRQTEGRVMREFDIRDKNIYLLCSKGRERSHLKDKILKTNDSGEKLMNIDESVIFNELKRIFYEEGESA